MVFSSIIFLFRFLPITLFVYYIAPQKFKNAVLVICSLFFYSWGEVKYFPIMIASILVDYIVSLVIERNREKKGICKICMGISLLFNLGMLFFFKYTNFFVDNINAFAGTHFAGIQLTLPLGISFYTFQTLSYTIDVYRGKTKAERNIVNFAAFVTLFPQLIAGPIVKYTDVSRELRERKMNLAQINEGITLFIFGLGKKVLIANNIGSLWNQVQDIGFSNVSTPLAWLGILAYSFQIYFDFSGYSLMAIGMGKMLGFEFPQNFNYPYISKSITEFWRRWHITLSTWFREYLYIPLGGNRRGRTRQIWNLFVVWSLTGLWHGASWNFVLWGIYYFILLTIEKIFLGEKLEQLPGWLQHVYTCLVVLFGWVIFANENIADLGRYFLTMFGANGALYNQTAIYQWYTHIPLLIVLIIGSTKLPKQLLRKGWTRLKLIDAISSRQEQIRFVATSIFTVLVLYCSVAFLVSGSYNPFLYFRF